MAIQQKNKKLLKSIAFVLLAGFLWANLAANYPQVKDLISSFTGIYQVMDLETAVEEEEIEENSTYKIISGTIAILPDSNLLCTKEALNSPFGPFHLSDIVTPPPESNWS